VRDLASVEVIRCAHQIGRPEAPMRRFQQWKRGEYGLDTRAGVSCVQGDTLELTLVAAGNHCAQVLV